MRRGTVKPIETEWNGYRWRSRLEARWGVFFNALGIKFVYEPEGYEASDGERYLPDFYFPLLDCFGEVKPDSNDVHLLYLKAQRFVMDGMGKKILFLIGVPDFRPYTIFRRIEIPDGIDSWSANALLDIHQKPRRYFQEHRLFEDFEDELFAFPEDFSERYREAVRLAKSARFDGKVHVMGGSACR